MAALPAEGLGPAVTGCPGWDVERLIGHLGRVHEWAASFLRLGPDGGTPDAGGRPPAGPDILPWYAERLDGLLAELDRHDPDEPSRSFAGPAPVAFWHRRQAHETAVHRWDAQDAITPGQADPIDARLAADGVDEWLTVFVPRWTQLGGATPEDLIGAQLALHCTDAPAGAPDRWILRLGPDGPQVIDPGDPDGPDPGGHNPGGHDPAGPAAAVTGPASDLLLAIWHRRALHAADRLTVSDPATATAILDTIHVT